MHAAAHMLHQTEARKRQIQGLSRALVSSGRGVMGCTLALTIVLTLFFGLPCLFLLVLVLPGLLEGWLEKASWLIAILPVPLSIFVGGVAASSLVRRAVRRVEAAAAAIPPANPGEPACCHVCGAPLSTHGTEAVVRCGFCHSDNVVTPRALALAKQRRDVVMDDYAAEIRRQGQGIAAFSLAGTLGWAALVLLTMFGSCGGARLFDDYLETATLPEGAVIAKRDTSPSAIALQNGTVYWFSGREVHWFSPATRKSGLLHEAASNSTHDSMAIDPSRVYFVSKRKLWAVPLDKTQPQVLADVPLASHANHRAAVSATHVYVTTTAGIVRVPKAGGSPEAIVQDPKVGEIAATTSGILWITTQYGKPGHTLSHARADGQGAQVIYQTEAMRTTQPIAADDSFAYVVSNYGSSLARVPLGGGRMTRVVDGHSELDIQAFTLDGPNIYYMTAYSSFGCSGSKYGELYVVPKRGGAAPRRIASGFKSVTGLATDAGHVYVADLFRRMVVQVKKP